jgi:hypothetical protein
LERLATERQSALQGGGLKRIQAQHAKVHEGENVTEMTNFEGEIDGSGAR